MRAFLSLVILSLLLTACAAPSLPPSTPTLISSPTFLPPTETPTATPTEVVYDYSKFDVSDKSTWPVDTKAAYEGLANRRPIVANVDIQNQYKIQDEIIHLDLMKGTISFLSQQGMDMSKYKNLTDKQLMNLNVSNEITSAFGNWQKAYFETTGQEAPLMPVDPWLMREMLSIDASGAGGSTDKVPVFGVKMERKGMLRYFSKFTLSAIIGNPADSDTAIIIVQYPGGTRPFLVNFKERPADNNMIIYDAGYLVMPSRKKPIKTIIEVNAQENKVDLSKQHFILSAIDGSDEMHDTEALNLNTIFKLIGSQLWGFQTDRLYADNYGAGHVDSLVSFTSLYDTATGLEILGGISHAVPEGEIWTNDKVFIKP